MNANQEIKKIIDDLMLNGHSLNPDKNEFVLTHVNGFIAKERSDLLADLRQKERDRKSKDKDPKNKKPKNKGKPQKVTSSKAELRKAATTRAEPRNLTEEEKKNLNIEKRRKNEEKHAAKLEQLGLTGCVFQYAEGAVRDWEEHAKDLVIFINNGRGQDILTALKDSVNRTSVCMESAVFCLVLLIKKSQNWIDEFDKSIKDMIKELALEKDTLKQLMGHSKTKDENLKQLLAQEGLTQQKWDIIMELVKIKGQQGTYLTLIQKCYSSLGEICKTTDLLMLFIEICKIFNYSKSNFTGFGRGMKSAIRKWYLSWDAADLAVEVTRNRGAYTWTHKHILIEAHISLKGEKKTALKSVEHAVVLNYIFAGFQSTSTLYEAESKVTSLLDKLNILNEGSLEKENAQLIVQRGENFVGTFNSVTVSDFNFHAFKCNELMTFLLNIDDSKLIIDALLRTCLFKSAYTTNEELNELADLLITKLRRENISQEVDLLNVLLAYNYTRRISSEIVRRGEAAQNLKKKKWLKKVNPDANRYQKPKNTLARSTKVNEIFQALDKIITDGTRGMSGGFKDGTSVFVNFDPTMICLYVGALPEDLVSKGLRATQVIAYILLVLGAHKNNFQSLLPLCTRIKDKFKDPNIQIGFSTLISALNNEIRKPVDNSKCSVSTSLISAIMKNSKTALLIFPRITCEVISDIYRNMKHIKNNEPRPQFRAIAFGLERPDETQLPEGFTPREDILLVFGFNRYTIPTMKDFINKIL